MRPGMNFERGFGGRGGSAPFGRGGRGGHGRGERGGGPMGQRFEGRAAFGPFGPGGFGGPGGPGGPGPFGPWGFGPGRGGRGGRGRARRGNVRASILALLRERPMHGYEMIQRIGELTEGGWRPSPGSVYPTLQLLEEEGLIASQEEGGKRLFRLTESGRSEAEAGPEEPWRQSGPDQPDLNALRDAKQTVGGLMGAVWQVMGSGSEEQRGKALGILDEARRKIYLLLAEAGGSGAAASSGDEPSDAASPDDEPEDA